MEWLAILHRGLEYLDRAGALRGVPRSGTARPGAVAGPAVDCNDNSTTVQWVLFDNLAGSQQLINLRAVRNGAWATGTLAVPPDEGGISLRDVRLRVPVADPSKIIAAPVNYRDHQAEMNVDTQVGALGFFLKAPSSLLDPGGTIQLPYHGRRFDQEGELALVIGRTARRVSEQDALACVFGYTGLLDITMRGGEDRSVRKSFETFTPMGPVLVTADEFGDPGDVDLRCWVSGDLRQKASTRDLIYCPGSGST
jgi:2-keto-4-pentenoate hydratase/2-oxohepta-3-ene-1,7-dioic acid hydratase in catechol pathway